LDKKQKEMYFKKMYTVLYEYSSAMVKTLSMKLWLSLKL